MKTIKANVSDETYEKFLWVLKVSQKRPRQLLEDIIENNFPDPLPDNFLLKTQVPQTIATNPPVEAVLPHLTQHTATRMIAPYKIEYNNNEYNIFPMPRKGVSAVLLTAGEIYHITKGDKDDTSL